MNRRLVLLFLVLLVLPSGKAVFANTVSSKISIRIDKKNKAILSEVKFAMQDLDAHICIPSSTKRATMVLSPLEEGTMGSYTPQTRVIEITSLPSHFLIRTVVVHEVAHYLDAEVLFPLIQKKLDKLKVEFVPSMDLGTWIHDMAMLRFRSDCLDTPTLDAIRKRVGNGELFYIYLLSPQETFARAFEEWMALEVGDRMVLDQIVNDSHDPDSLHFWPLSKGRDGQYIRDEGEFCHVDSSMTNLLADVGILVLKR